MVPTLDRLEPAEGHPGGHTLVRVYGAGFQLPVQQAAVGGVVPPSTPSVGVYFGGVSALRVDVLSAGLLSVLVPPTSLDVPLAVSPNPGGVLVDVVVANLGKYGERLGGAATRAGGFRYRRPRLNEGGVVDSVIRTLVAALRREVYPEVVYALDVDWTDDARLLAGLAPLVTDAGRKPGEGKPTAVVLAGPRLAENKVLRHSQSRVGEAGGVARAYRVPLTVDAVFTLGAYSPLAADVQSLSAALLGFVRRHPWLEVPQGSSPSVRYDFGFASGAELAVDVSPLQSNSKSVAWSVAVSGLELVGSPLVGDMAEREVVAVDGVDVTYSGA